MRALHIPTEAVIACELAPDNLLGRPATDLWKVLGAKEQPSNETILRVISDGAVDVVFYRRLAAYLKGGGDPDALECVACIRTAAGMKPPVAVAIAGRTSFWGPLENHYQSWYSRTCAASGQDRGAAGHAA